MGAISFEQTNPILHDEDMLRIGRDVLSEIKTAAVRVAKGYAMPKEKGSWEALMSERLKKIEPVRRERGLSMLREIADNPTLRKQELGRFADVGLESPELLRKVPISTVGRTSVKRLERMTLKDASFPFHPYIRVYGGSPVIAPVAAVAAAPTYKYRYLRFKMDKVFCVDETGWDSWGSDEIWMGGTAVDETGDVTKISSWEVSNDFDTGETKNYNPDKLIQNFNVTEGGNNWPKHYFVHLVMAERDLGDFPDWISKLYEKVKGRLKEWLAGVGGSIGGWIGAAIGWIGGWILDNAISWIKTLWEDDLIAKCTYHLTHVGPGADFNGSPKSSVAAINYYGGSGKYRVWSYWEFAK